MMMKSYFAESQLHISGKAWEVRALLAKWAKQAGSSTEVRDFIATYTRRK